VALADIFAESHDIRRQLEAADYETPSRSGLLLAIQKHLKNKIT
jgi:hypothetical protein